MLGRTISGSFQTRFWTYDGLLLAPTGPLSDVERGMTAALLTAKGEIEVMYAVVRTYSGPGANELFELLEQRKAEVDDLIRPVGGFVSYSLIRTDDGGVTITVCEDKTGTDESIQVARDWIQANASDLAVNPPSISEGQVSLHLT